MTMYNNFKEVISMSEEPERVKNLTAAEKESWKGIKSEETKSKPKKLPIKLVDKFYKDYQLEPIVMNFKKVCDGLAGQKKFSSTDALGDIKALALDTYTKSIEPCIKTFGFTNKTKLGDFCKTILTCLKCTEDVFSQCVPTRLYKTFTDYCKQLIPDFNIPTLNNNELAKAVKFLLKKQTFIEDAYKKHVWGSDQFDAYGKIKDDNYEKLKAALKQMQTAYEALQKEGGAKLAKDRQELRNLKNDIAIYDDQNAKQKELKKWCESQFNKLMENHVAFSEYISIDPCGPIRLFIDDVRKLAKGDFTIEETTNVTSATAVKITKQDAERRKNLLQNKHWNKIQQAFVDALANDPLNPNFQKTKQLVDNSNIRSKRLILQLKDPNKPSGNETVEETTKGKIVVAVENYFLELENELTKASETATPEKSLNFVTLKRTLPLDWKSSVQVIYCISVIYEHALNFVTLLTEYLTKSTKMLQTANGTVTKQDATFKFGADVLGKLATVAAFTGPLVNVSPIFAAIWGAVALSGTIVQIVQVVYNRHQAKKTAEAKANLLKSTAARDVKQMAPSAQHDTVDGDAKIGDDRAEVETKTDNAEVTELNDKISELNILKKALTSQNKKLMSENKRYKQKVKELEAELAELKSANPQLSQNAVDAH